MTEPTDAEIIALADETRTAEGGASGYILPISFARAVLAKWGSQQPVAPIHDLGFIIEQRAGVDVLVWDKGGCRPATSTEIAMWHSLAASLQPTQAQAVNQADRPFIVRLAEDFAEDCVTAGYVTTKAASYGRLMDEALSTQAQAGAVPLTCEWAHNEDDGFWDTECGRSWRFDDGGPKENHMNFYHCCGKPLRIKGGQHGTE